MNGVARRIKRLTSPRNFIGSLAIFVTILWFVGLTDHLYAKSFDEFTWPRGDENFKFPRIINPQSCPNPLLILVKSARQNKEHRDAIRQTWAKSKNNFDLFFIIGKDSKTEETIKEKDVIQLDIIDSYRNNTLKFFGSIDFIKSCGNPDFIFLVDDDYLINIKNLQNMLKLLDPNDKIYTGFVFNSSPFRFNFHKHRISLEEYPFNAYPAYVSAGAVVLSRKTAHIFHENIPKLKDFPFDDVFTGILAKVTGIRPIHNENFKFWTSQISKNEWNSPDFIGVHGYAGAKLVEEYEKMNR